jgi:hypothetical protein
MMKVLNVFLFGPPRLAREGEAVPVNRRKMLALLAYLLVTGQPHSRDALAACCGLTSTNPARWQICAATSPGSKKYWASGAAH